MLGCARAARAILAARAFPDRHFAPAHAAAFTPPTNGRPTWPPNHAAAFVPPRPARPAAVLARRAT
jgi:hypothetical protein